MNDIKQCYVGSSSDDTILLLPNATTKTQEQRCSVSILIDGDFITIPGGHCLQIPRVLPINRSHLGQVHPRAASVQWIVLAICSIATLLFTTSQPILADEPARPIYKVHHTKDFKITGNGAAPEWKNAPWATLSRRGTKGHPYETKVKALYSDTGIYVLMHATDKKLTSTMTKDFDTLWMEDVFEVFMWTDENYPVYFEYEISPLGYELPIIIPNFGGKFYGWKPWMYFGDRKTKKATAAQGGKKKSGATVTGWSAEVFFPYDLLKPLQNVPPKPGTRWRANFYRMDYDDGKPTSWDWARVGPSFHEYKKFGTWEFQK